MCRVYRRGEDLTLSSEKIGGSDHWEM